MRVKFETFYKGLMVVLALALFWAVWAHAQPAINPGAAAPANPAVENAPSTNAGPAMANASAGAETNRLDYLTFGLDRITLLNEHALLGQPVWRYLASFIYIFLAFYVSKFLDYATRVWLKRLAAKTKTRFDDLLLEALNGPVKVVAFVIFLHIGLSLFRWPDVFSQIIHKGLTIIVAISLTYMVLKLVELVLGAWQQRVTVAEADRHFNQLLFPMIGKAVKVFIVVVAVLVTAPHLGLNITGLVASLSIGGLALGLAAQDTVANLFGAVAIFADKPFHLGDYIKLEVGEGSVESIGLRSTRLRNPNGHLITVPNKTMGNAAITNITRRPNIKTEMNIGVTYDTPVEKVKLALQILEEVYGSHKMTENVWVSFNKFADSALNILVVHWWNATDYRAYLAGMQELNLEIKRRFDAAGIEFAFPTQTLHLKSSGEPAPEAKSRTDRSS